MHARMQRGGSEASVDVRRTALLFATAFAVLLAHAATFLPFVCDDALISLRYAERLCQGHGLTWTDGERVEGYTNLLWVLLCAGLHWLGLDLVTAARLLGAACMALLLAALAVLHPVRRAQAVWPVAVAPLLLAATPPLALWTFGGLEPPLTMALLAWSVLAGLALVRHPSIPRALTLGLPLALLVLARGDGPVFVIGLALAAAWLLRRNGLAAALGIAALWVLPPLLAFAAQLGFRLAYYHDWLPNTAYVKVVPTLSRALSGLIAYTLPAALAMGGAVILAGVGLVTARRRGDRLLPCMTLLPALLWSVHISLIGGDYMVGWRHHLATATLLLLLGTAAVPWWTARPRRWRWALLLLLASAATQLLDFETRRARSEDWEWTGKAVGTMLGSAFAAQRPLVAVEAAGTVPFFSGLPALDLYGLNDRHIARQPAHPGLLIGHDHGDGLYALSRRPDLVVFGFYGATFFGPSPSAEAMVRTLDFLSHYRPVVFATAPPDPVRARLWVRTDGLVGIVRTDRGIVVPAYLFGALDPLHLDAPDPQALVERFVQSPPQQARLDRDGNICGEVLTAAPLSCSRVAVPAGRWRVALQPRAAPFRVFVRDSTSKLELPTAGAPDCIAITASDGQLVDIVVQAQGPLPAQFTAVRLEPVR